MSYIFIVNPHARSGMGGVTWDLIEPELKKKKETLPGVYDGKAGACGEDCPGGHG